MPQHRNHLKRKILVSLLLLTLDLIVRVIVRTESYHPSNVCMGGMAIVKSETLDVLGTSIRSDLRCDDHVFNVSKEAAKC